MTPETQRALVEALREIIVAIDKKAVSIDSPNIGGGCPEIGYEQHYWHEEWLHHARAALARAEKEGTP
jgi:hypothetical protein